jgi:hypothetical protein
MMYTNRVRKPILPLGLEICKFFTHRLSRVPHLMRRTRDFPCLLNSFILFSKVTIFNLINTSYILLCKTLGTNGGGLIFLRRVSVFLLIILLSSFTHNASAAEQAPSVQVPAAENKQLAMRFRCYLYQLKRVEQENSSSVSSYKKLLQGTRMPPFNVDIKAALQTYGLLDKNGQIPQDVKNACIIFGPNSPDFQALGQVTPMEGVASKKIDAAAAAWRATKT